MVVHRHTHGGAPTSMVVQRHTHGGAATHPWWYSDTPQVVQRHTPRGAATPPRGAATHPPWRSDTPQVVQRHTHGGAVTHPRWCSDTPPVVQRHTPGGAATHPWWYIDTPTVCMCARPCCGVAPSNEPCTGSVSVGQAILPVPSGSESRSLHSGQAGLPVLHQLCAGSSHLHRRRAPFPGSGCRWFAS
jgi:hypothetical protein